MFKTIKSRLIATCMLIVVAAISIATTGSYLAVSADARQQVLIKLGELGNAHAAGIAGWVKTQKDIVTALAPAVAADEPAASLTQALHSGRLDLAYVGRADRRMQSIPDRKRPPEYDPTARPWYKLAQSSDTAVITAPYIAASSKKLVVSFAYAVKSGGATHAVVGTDVSLDDVIATLHSIKPTPGGFAMLVDPSGKIIAHPDAALSMKPATELSPQLDAALLGRIGGTDLVSAEVAGRSYFLKSTRVTGTDWQLVTAADEDEALAALSALLATAGVSLVIVVLLSILASAIAINLMLRGLSQVRDAMDQIGSGDGDLRHRLVSSGEDEIAHIARSFNQFVEKIEQVVLDVRRSSQSIAVASQEIAAGSQDLSGRTEKTASSLQSTASSMEELTTTVGHSADAARSANQLASQASSVAQKGSTAVGEVVRTMAGIHQPKSGSYPVAGSP